MINDEDAKRNIAFHVNRLLETYDRSRYWLAKETGAYESRIASICNGQKLCSAAMLARLASALNVATDDLLKPVPRVGKKSRAVSA